MIRFLYPHWLSLLALLPLLASLRGRRGSVAAVQYSSPQTLRQVASDTRSRAGRWLTTLNLAVLALPIVGLARPQLGHTAHDVQASGIDLILAVDVSGSMEALAISSPSEAAAANPAAMDLAPNKVEPGSFVSSLRPVLFAPWFIALQGLPAMALVIVLIVHCRRQRHAHDLNHTGERAAEAAIREQLAAMDAALAANCAPAFFRAARHAVQELLAQRWKLPVSQVTVTEIDHRLNGNGEDLRALFAFADGVVYSGQRVLPEDLKRWKDTVIQHLKKLEDL